MYSSKSYWTLSYFRFYNFGCVSISAFASLVGISIGITSSAARLKICAITAGIKKYKPVTVKDKEAWWNSIVSKTKIK